MLDEPIDRIILDAQVEGLDLIPSDKNLVGAAVELVNMENREYRLQALDRRHPGALQLRSNRLSARLSICSPSTPGRQRLRAGPDPM